MEYMKSDFIPNLSDCLLNSSFEFIHFGVTSIPKLNLTMGPHELAMKRMTRNPISLMFIIAVYLSVLSHL